MSLEQKIDTLTIEITKLADVIKAGKGGAAGGGASSGGGSKGSVTQDQVKAAALKVKEAKGAPAAQKLIKDVGKAGKLAEIPEKNWSKFVEACEAVLKDEGDGGDTGGDDL